MSDGALGVERRRLTFADVELGSSIAKAAKRAGNPYLPETTTLLEIIQETPNIKSFRVRFDDDLVQAGFSFQPGQVGQLGVLGLGRPLSPSIRVPPRRSTCSSLSCRPVR